MEYNKLGRSGIKVSRICLGTMTWGEQNSEAEGHAQMDAAFDYGVNFIDTAEMYPVSPRKETYGDTERIVGSWMAARGNRDKVILATKVIGPGDMFTYIRGGDLKHTAQGIEAALEESLKRLKTDYVDLYQVHWPDRNTNYFGQRGYNPANEREFTPPEEVLATLDKLVGAGKIRAIGLSNESPWGVMKYLALSEALGKARVVSVQNPYSLLNRLYEIGLAEVGMREEVGLLAYSPLGCGCLSGKYLNGQSPAGARLTIWPKRYKRYTGDNSLKATTDYVALARLHGLDPSQMAIAYLLTKPFLAAAIIGATTMEQLNNNLAAADLVLSEDVLKGIEAIQKTYPDPAS